MGIIYCLLLLSLGTLGASETIAAKLPAGQNVLTKLRSSQHWLGIAGLAIGIVSIVQWIIMATRYGVSPLALILGLLAAFSMTALGLIFSLDYLRATAVNPVSPFLRSLARVRLKLLPYRRAIGVIAILLAVVHCIT